MGKVIAEYDCARQACRRYHEVSRHPWRDNGASPRCGSCRQTLRLLRIVRTMDADTRALLAQRRKP